LDVEAAVSGSEGEGGSGSDGPEDEDGGSLADFIAEPSAEELEQAGLVFQSSDDEDPTAVLREARPFARNRRMREPKPSEPRIGLAAGEGAGSTAGVSELGDKASPSFLHLVSGCSGWLPDVSLLFDRERSETLYEAVLQGYTYHNEVVRKAKRTDIARGSLELTAITAYCAHILTVRCGLLWAGGAPSPGSQVPGVLMRPHAQYPRVVCEEVKAHGDPLDLSTLLNGLVLGHPGNEHWRNLAVGRQLYKTHQLVYLVQSQVRARRARGEAGRNRGSGSVLIWVGPVCVRVSVLCVLCVRCVCVLCVRCVCVLCVCCVWLVCVLCVLS
jgi:hypothetical protein